MIRNNKTANAGNLKAILSTLWIFLSVNYIFCDVLSNMEAGALKGLLAGNVGGVNMTQGMLLFAAISLEIPFVMIVLSRVLNYKANRWTNIIAGIMMVVYQMGSFSFGTPPTLHYIFFSIIEIAGNLLIIWLALRWRDGEAGTNKEG